MDYKYGVSPAFLLSLFGDDFTPNQVVEAIPLIKELGFDCFQCEIVDAGKLKLWEDGGAEKVKQMAVDCGLIISQFVAHLMLNSFCSADVLCSNHGIDEMRRVFGICRILGFEGQVTVPVGPFKYPENPEDKAYYVEAMRRKFGIINAMAEENSCRIAIEVQPDALVQGSEGIIGFIESVGDNVGYNYDTGHAWASGAANVAEFPTVFGSKLFGTHLCDNDGKVNLSLCPGEGTIDWPAAMNSLVKSGYPGSVDLEIFTTADKVREKYTKGKAYLSELLQA